MQVCSIKEEMFLTSPKENAFFFVKNSNYLESRLILSSLVFRLLL